MNRLTGTAVGGGLALALLLSGCGGGSDASEGPAAPTGSGSTSPSQSSSDSAGETPSSTSTVEPATGPLLEAEHATMIAPTGYRHIPDMVEFETSAGGSRGGSIDVVTLGETPWGSDEDLDEAVRLTTRSWPAGRPDRLADVEIDGVPAFHLAGLSGKYTALEEYGALYQGDLVYFTFSLDNINSKAKRRAAIESSLATVRWR
ncbi:hypothetical protein GCM10009844_45110 [Nocardioides koreensis]|uniref:Lipoprotein n=1 Tax=Nocardioides koreensis TaxID=433651 RepID=A0ABP5M4A0_9ACTN